MVHTLRAWLFGMARRTLMDRLRDVVGEAHRSRDRHSPDTWTDEADADLRALDGSLARSGGADNGALFFCYEDIAIERLTLPAIVFRK